MKLRIDYLKRFQIPMAGSPPCVRMPEMIAVMILAKCDRTDW